MSHIFEMLLKETGELLNIKDLHLDANNSCLVKFPTGLEIQMEPDKSHECLIIGVKLGSLQPGRYRENIFSEALKANNLPFPRFGSFGYSMKSDNLYLFEKMPIDSLTALKLFEFLKPFAEKALSWKEALSRGEIPSILQSYGRDEAVGLFGPKK